MAVHGLSKTVVVLMLVLSAAVLVLVIEHAEAVFRLRGFAAPKHNDFRSRMVPSSLAYAAHGFGDEHDHHGAKHKHQRGSAVHNDRMQAVRRLELQQPGKISKASTCSGIQSGWFAAKETSAIHGGVTTP
jgi:hypothetical protein